MHFGFPTVPRLAKENSGRAEGIDDEQPVEVAFVLKVLGEENAATGLLCRVDNQCVPEREPVQTMQVDGGQNISCIRNDHMEVCEQPDLALCDRGIKLQFARNGNEVLLQDLNGNHPGPCTAMFCKQVEGAAVLSRSRGVIRIDQNVRIQKATNAHGVRRD